MARVIRHQEAYDHRDAFNFWHENTLPSDFKGIDIDFYGYCPRCQRGLYLIEYSTNPNKVTRALEGLAEAARIRAYLVLFNHHTDTSGCALREVWPKKAWIISQWTALSELEKFFLWLRGKHAEVCARRAA